MKGSYLGEFEELVMLATAILYDEAYGYAITKEISERGKRKASLSAVHAALNRLENKGYLHSRMAESTTRRGGKKRRFFELTSSGKAALQESRQLRQHMWAAIPRIVFE